MSLWLQLKGKDSKTHIYAVPLLPLLIVPLIGISIALLLPIIQAIRAWLGG
jgi:hypothetical protein